jgi:hypothetical protein
MKSFQNKKIKPCNCGSSEFITKPNRYDVYEIINGQLELVSSETTDDELILYCRECGEELKNGADFITQ